MGRSPQHCHQHSSSLTCLHSKYQEAAFQPSPLSGGVGTDMIRKGSRMRSQESTKFSGPTSATERSSYTKMSGSTSDNQQTSTVKTTTDKQGSVKITLHSIKDDFDEKAEVKVALSDPDAVVEKMLNTLAQKFPPESVMTIQTTKQLSDDSFQARCGGSTASSDIGIEVPSNGKKMHESNRLSGRHYLGLNGEFYAELADSKGRPLQDYVRDPSTREILPVGREVIHPETGQPITNMIIGSNGKPSRGLPIPPEGLDGNGRPQVFYEAIDGTHPKAVIGQNGRPLVGLATDPVDGGIKRIGLRCYENNGSVVHGFIEGPENQRLRGIPLKPMQSLSCSFIEKPYHPSYLLCPTLKPSRNSRSGLHSLNRRSPTHSHQPSYPISLSPIHNPHSRSSSQEMQPMKSLDKHVRSPTSRPYKKGLLPTYTHAIDGARLPVAEDEVTGQPMIGYTRDPKDNKIKPVGPPYCDTFGNAIPGYITSPDGQCTPGCPVIIDELPVSRDHQSTLAYCGQSKNFTEPTVHPQLDENHCRVQKSYPTDIRNTRPRSSEIPTIPLCSAASTIKIPVPSYPLIDGTYAPVAVGPDGHSIDGRAQDPTSGSIVPVGRSYTDSNGKVVNGMVIDFDGRVVQGLGLAPKGWHVRSQQPLPFYLAASGQWVPMYVDPEGHLIHGWAKDPKTTNVLPVGLQVLNEFTLPVPGMIIGPDGKTTQGISLSVVEDTSQPHLSQSSRQNVNEIRLPLGQPTLTQPPVLSKSQTDDDCLVRYIEIPVVQEKIVEVPKREVREVEKHVPKMEVVEIVKEVQVPQIQYIDKHVEVPQIEEVVKEVKVKKVVDRPYEVLVHRPKIETKFVEQVIEVPRIERIEKPVFVPNYINKEVPTVVAQQLQPIIRQVSNIRKVPCTITEPRIITVDVFIPKPVISTISGGKKILETHKTVDVPAAQFNALTKRLNISLDQSHIESLFIKEGAGVPILPSGERVETVEPVSSDWVWNHDVGRLHCSTRTGIPYIDILETLGIPNGGLNTTTTTMGFSSPDGYAYSKEENNTHSTISGRLGQRSSPHRHSHRKQVTRNHYKGHRQSPSSATHKKTKKIHISIN